MIIGREGKRFGMSMATLTRRRDSSPPHQPQGKQRHSIRSMVPYDLRCCQRLFASTTTTTNLNNGKKVQKSALSDVTDDSSNITTNETGKSGLDSSWIPPSRPLLGDQGYSHLYEEEVKNEVDDKRANVADSKQNLDAWIPPKRPLLGDQGYSNFQLRMQNNPEAITEKPDHSLSLPGVLGVSHREDHSADHQSDKETKIVAPLQNMDEMYQNLSEEDQNKLLKDYKDLKEADRVMMTLSTNPAPPPPATIPKPETVDWLKTRRATLAGRSVGDSSLTSQSRATPTVVSADSGLIPVLKHVLLTEKEIVSILQAYGGVDVVTILENPDDPVMAGELGMVIVTAPTDRHLMQMSHHLVRSLRDRRLQEVGVNSAMDGPQGNHDGSTWVVVDCRNYVVHIQMEHTRKHVNLEYLYSGQDPIRYVNPNDDNAVDHYVLNINPAPLEYGPPVANYDSTLKRLEKNRYTVPHRPVVKKKVRPRRLGSRQRR